MKFETALLALRTGNKIRFHDWPKGCFFLLDDNKITNEEGCEIRGFIRIEDIINDEWEIFDEKPQLCEHGNIIDGSHHCLYCLGWCEHTTKRDNCKICQKEKQDDCLKQILCKVCNKEITTGKIDAYSTHFCSLFCMNEYEKVSNIKNILLSESGCIKEINEKINIIFKQLSKFERRLDNLPYEFDTKFKEGQKWFDKAMIDFNRDIIDIRKEIYSLKAFERE